MPERLLRRPEVLARLGVATSTLYEWMTRGGRKYRPDFPLPVVVSTDRLGRASVVAWRESELDAWIASRPERQQVAA